MKPVGAQDLVSGDAKSCGCLKLDMFVERFTTHGGSSTPEYAIWYSMIRRCETPSDTNYPRYGACGIRACDRWRHSFENFLADMGPRPSPEHSIDRIESAGNYEPGNCRWTTRIEQNRNRRSNRMVTWNGRTQTLAAWAEEVGIYGDLLSYRLNAGWSVERALTTPARGCNGSE